MEFGRPALCVVPFDGVLCDGGPWRKRRCVGQSGDWPNLRQKRKLKKHLIKLNAAMLITVTATTAIAT